MKKYNIKEDVLNLICNASTLGNLGLFIGAGFSKAMLEDSFEYRAYSWYELLEKCCDKMNIDLKILKQKGSLSEIASYICKQYATNKKVTYEESINVLKNLIAELTNVYPTSESITKYRKLLSNIEVDWIATTNYDMILENIFTGRCLPLGPNECFVKVNNLIPIYHIHGIRTVPNSIVITNEDYVSLFRPNDYRQSRLPFLMKESFVLMIGYGLGDINVITALDWSKNVYTNVSENYDTEIIQLLYTDNPKDKPYRDSSGVLIIEINNLINFFQELNDYFRKYSKSYNEKLDKINGYIKMFVSPKEDDIMDFIDNSVIRKEIIEYIANLGMEYSYIYPNYIIFLQKIIEELNERAKPNGAFSAYDQKLNVLIDIFEYIDIKKVPPSFFSMLAESFDSVAYYVGDGMGESWEAKKTWENENHRIPKDVVDELKRYEKSKPNLVWYTKLLKSK
ncbi:MAG: SIR2 family protein [Clostridiaceae bacterium]